MAFMDNFREHYKERFRCSSASALVEQEQLLSDFIDNDDFMSIWLMDEAIVMYELIRDECVYRVAKIADMED